MRSRRSSFSLQRVCGLTTARSAPGRRAHKARAKTRCNKTRFNPKAERKNSTDGQLVCPLRPLPRLLRRLLLGLGVLLLEGIGSERATRGNEADDLLVVTAILLILGRRRPLGSIVRHL